MIQAFGLTSSPRKELPPAVDDVSFEVRAGRVTALLGAPGAGKTTALRLMLELQHGRGLTYFRGRPLHRIAHPSREVGVLLGDVPGHPARTVRGHLRMLCAAAGVPVQRADEVMESVGLVSLRDERLGTLSRGMDRRLGLACALVPDPHTLVFDDPAGALSAREARWLHGALRAHAVQGGTVLFSTADPKEAARTADHVVTLEQGRVVADQEAADFSRTRLRPRVAVRSPHAARLGALLAQEARSARRSVEVVREGGNRLAVYGSTCADIGETAFRHGILVHQLADEVGDMGPGAGAGDACGAGDSSGACADAGAGAVVPPARHRAADGERAPAPRRPTVTRPSPTGPPRPTAATDPPEPEPSVLDSAVVDSSAMDPAATGAAAAELPGTGPAATDRPATEPHAPESPATEPQAPESPAVDPPMTALPPTAPSSPASDPPRADAPQPPPGEHPTVTSGDQASSSSDDRTSPAGDRRPEVAESIAVEAPAAPAAPAIPGPTDRPRHTQRTYAALTPGAASVLPPPISVRSAPSPLRPLRYEIRRAVGISTGFVIGAVVLVVSAVMAVVLARVGHTPQARLLAAWPRELPLPPAALGAGLFGALAFGDEFRHPALAADRGTVPRRLGLLTAKLVVSAAVALVLAALTAGCNAEVLHLFYGRELARIPADWSVLGAGWAGLVVGCAWSGVLAAGLFRSTTAGLAAVVAVPVVVVPLVQKAWEGPDVRTAAGLPLRVREVLLTQWPFGGERYVAEVLRVVVQPVGGAMTLSLTALLCAFLLTSLRSRVR
ncbi:ATP-binding cassette domain-containing protein [Streptomyces sp. NPDC000349]|uniref:ABC transporter ATP-binding protein n=1 Tax=unclassified Streptomyces TaxID=2593676 RepID=UPI002780D285|nr:ABC transporter ATP-binding protein [Streptomyces sp. DSM 40167]MDQ0406747.1 ABC-type multidrug transport system ATPase subunit [Streptomyces sp. DSM 40167]